MTKKKSNVELEKLEREYALDHGIDFENRVIRVTGAIGTPGPMSDDGDYFDFNLCDFALTRFEKDPDLPVTLKINSPGGECYEALAIIGRLKSSQCAIITEGYGHVMSAATLILMGGDIRKLSKYCISMFHEISYGVGGNHEDVKEHVLQSEKEMKRWAGYYEEFSKKSAKWWLGKMKKKEYYPTPKEMLEVGAVDEII